MLANLGQHYVNRHSELVAREEGCRVRRGCNVNEVSNSFTSKEACEQVFVILLTVRERPKISNARAVCLGDDSGFLWLRILLHSKVHSSSLTVLFVDFELWFRLLRLAFSHLQHLLLLHSSEWTVAVKASQHHPLPTFCPTRKGIDAVWNCERLGTLFVDGNPTMVWPPFCSEQGRM